jgi:microcystin-dependent protein
MADTVTAKLGLTKPEVGASNNTWGTKWNGNADILEAKTVRQTAQWTITPGDDTVGSTAGPWLLTRYGNDGLRIDDPISVNRQSGAVAIPKINIPFGTVPANPPAGSISMYADSYGNVIVVKPDGSTSFLGVPPGTIVYTSAASADFGYALCQGQAISRALNPYMFARIGGTYGNGDGSTTFNLPDARGRVIAMIDSGTGRLVNAFNGSALGANGGLDYHYLTGNQTPVHTHGYSGSNATASMNRSNPHTHATARDTGEIYTTNAPGVGGGSGGGGVFGHSGYSYAPTNTDVNHEHGFGWSGNTDGGAGLASNWHPNVQPTICLNVQIKLG